MAINNSKLSKVCALCAAGEPGTLRMHAPAARFFRARRSSSVALKDEYARI